MKGQPDVVIKAAVGVKGERLIVDLDGLLPGQLGGNGWCITLLTPTYFMAMEEHVRSGHPNNDGCTKPIN